MVISESELTLGGGARASVTNFADDAIRVVIHAQKILLSFRLVPDSPTGIRLEQFQPEHADPSLPALAIAALRILLAQNAWQYVVALYPSLWQSSFEQHGFHHLSERNRWEMALAPEQIQHCIYPEEVQVAPLAASAEHLGQLLCSAESNPAISVRRCIEFCRTLLAGAYGPLIEMGSYEIAMQHEPCGACLFTNYYGEALLAHIFIARPLQGRGLASALLQHSLAGLARAGYPKATASTDATNHASRLLHTRVGFTELLPMLSCSMLKQAAWKNGGIQ